MATTGLITEHNPSHKIDQFTLSDTSTTRYSTAASCHDIDIEGVAEKRVVVGDNELYI